jgi:maltose O-acetyltransferase
MSLLSRVASVLRDIKESTARARIEQRWKRLRSRGMVIGKDVWLPSSTWIDSEFCFLISIGDHCGFGEECFILAHDAQMDEFLDAARIGRVIVHDSCHIGARTVILPGVEIGPKTIVGANSLVSRSLPPETVCAGSPAKVICSLAEYLQKHRERLAEVPTFSYSDRQPTAAERASIIEALRQTDGYIVGGRSAELRGEGGTPRTAAG